MKYPGVSFGFRQGTVAREDASFPKRACPLLNIPPQGEKEIVVSLGPGNFSGPGIGGVPHIEDPFWLQLLLISEGMIQIPVSQTDRKVFLEKLSHLFGYGN